MSRRYYVAGPMSNLPELNFPAFHSHAARLRSMGHHVSNPAEINADSNPSWLEAMRADIKHLVDCDSILMLPGWEKSKGASLEHHIAKELGMTIEYAEGECPFKLEYPATRKIEAALDAQPSEIPASLRIGEIARRLKFAVTAEFLGQLGFLPAATEGAAKLYHERDFKSICAALQRHIDSVQQQF